MRLAALIVALTSMALFGRATVAWASPGELDAEFGPDGRILTALSFGSDEGRAIVLQPDGRIVAVGSVESERAFGLTRYEADGTLDPSFGNGGRVVTMIGDGGPAAAAVGQDDGKIIAAGWARIGNRRSFTLARYDRDGRLDASFGEAGIAVTRFDAGEAAVRALALQADGKLVAAGVACTVFSVECTFAVARYEVDGTLDTTFGDGGRLVVATEHDETQAAAVVVQPDGKIVIGGGTTDRPGGFPLHQMALVRFRPDGTRDPSFGNDGVATVRFGFSRHEGGAANALALDAAGKIVVAGTVFVEDESQGNIVFAVARFDDDGSLDPSFGTVGLALLGPPTPSRVSLAHGIAIQPDGKIVAAGNHGSSDFLLARFHAHGALDASFGTGGLVTTSITGFDAAYGLALRPDGRILTVGWSTPGLSGRGSFALTRHLGGFCGDADRDGAIGVTDGVQVLRAAARLPSSCAPEGCDVDESGDVTATDGVRVLRHAAGLSASLPCPGMP